MSSADAEAKPAPAEEPTTAVVNPDGAAVADAEVDAGGGAAADASSGDKRKRGDDESGDSSVKLDKSAVMKQLKFYFSDSNLPRDKFLKGLVDTSDEGWIDFATIAKFKRMVTLCPSQDLAILGGVIREDGSDFLEVNEDNSKIRRSPKHPLPAESQFEKRAIYIKGWDLQGTTIDTVEKYFTDKGYKVLQVRLRRAPMTREFKGSTFIEMGSVEEATRCVAEKHSLGDRELLVEMKAAYHERKSAERKERRKQKAGDNGAGPSEDAAAAAAPTDSYDKGCVLAFEGVTDETSREDLKEIFEKHGTVSWIDFQRGDSAGEIRFAAAGEAIKVKEAYESAPAEIQGKVPTLRVLEGEDEKAFWAKVAESKRQRYERSKRKGGGRGGYSRKGSYRGGKRKSSDGESQAKRARTED